ncbi:hypothetical protein D046_5860B, partial [Vibrio parahaemolyticus V-223/04]
LVFKDVCWGICLQAMKKADTDVCIGFLF